MGIICACMPSAAYTCRQTLPSFDTMKTLLYSRPKSFGSSLETNGNSISDTGKPIQSNPNGSHNNLHSSKNPQDSKLAQHQTVQTVIEAGNHGDVENNGIHIDYSFQTSWEQV